MIEDNLIESRINKFLGYGNLNSDIWFVGMEEGSDGELNGLTKAFKNTYEKYVIDLRKQDGVVNHSSWFEGNSPPLQRTWDKFIQILLALENKDFEDIKLRKEFQKYNLGDEKSNHAIIELMPLPEKNISSWVYSKFSNLSYLGNRKSYFEEVLPKRIALLRRKIKEHKPNLIVFCSNSYNLYWRIIMSDLDTKYVVIPHPVARGMTKENWKEIIEKVKEEYYN